MYGSIVHTNVCDEYVPTIEQNASRQIMCNKINLSADYFTRLIVPSYSFDFVAALTRLA